MAAEVAAVVEQAPAKVNLVLWVGPRRDDDLHELCSLVASIDLADTLRFESVGTEDEVICPGVDGPNLVEDALAAFRHAAPGPVRALRVAIEKRIPVAAGLGGGSADAAAALRASNRLAGDPLDTDALRALGVGIGSDVPSQVEPRHTLVAGAGERVEPVDLPPMTMVLVPAASGLATEDVYAEADRIGATRDQLDEETVRALAERPLAELADAMENDLEAAALSLRPELEATRARLLESGALGSRVSGSGPTVFGVFEDESGASAAAAGIRGAIVARTRDV